MRVILIAVMALICSCSDRGIQRLPESGIGTVYKIGKNTEGDDVYIRRITVGGEYIFLQCNEVGNFITGAPLSSCESAAKKVAKETVDNILDALSD